MRPRLVLLVIVSLVASSCAATRMVAEDSSGLDCGGAGTVTEVTEYASGFSGFDTPEEAILETTFGQAVGVGALSAQGATWVLRIDGRPTARFDVTRLEGGGFVVSSSDGCADLFEELTGR